MRAPQAVLFALTLAASEATVVAQTRPTAAAAYRIIVNPSNPTKSVDRKFLADAFLKKVTRWAHGELIRPVDLNPDSPARNKFSDEVLQRSVAAIKSYWQQLVFSGRDLPPPELDTDEDVVKYVLKHSGAIGYVSGSANLNGARPVTVE